MLPCCELCVNKNKNNNNLLQSMTCPLRFVAFSAQNTATTSHNHAPPVLQLLLFIINLSVPLLVTNDLLPQSRYSIRGLSPGTAYDLKVTAHNHAGSTAIGYVGAIAAQGLSGLLHSYVLLLQ